MRISTCLLVLFVFNFVVNAEGNKVELDRQGNLTPSEMREKINREQIERIDVKGRTPLAFYKREFEMAELDFYDMFNSLNEVNDFTMFCRKSAPTGSRIKRTYCYPQYLLKRHAFETQNAIANTPPQLLASGSVRGLPTIEQVEAMVSREREAALQYAEKLVKDNPSLLKQLIKMKEAELLYLEKKERFKNRDKR